MPTKSNNVFGALALLTLLVISLAFTVLAITYCRKGKDIFRAENKAADQSQQSHLQPLEAGSWRFIVSGDSRNCGDVIMPAIAAHSASRFQPSFYWHLGDLRAIYMVDEDMAFADHQSDGKKLACGDYLKQAWPDFVKHQIYPFGRTPFYLGLGNHEVIPPKGYPLGSPQSLQPEINSSQFTAYFADWLLAPAVKAQRAKDHDCDKPSPAPCVISPRNYYHWIQGGVDFIYLDNASHILGPAQLGWFKDRVTKAGKDSAVRTLIVGMHEAMPDSISTDHA
ncbi:MAG TPA: hypothetical protein VFT65_03165, partial [Candidatus Angelobacter sp.]|nr:hypothetical protein [Candidatus Angelobacter sp.]